MKKNKTHTWGMHSVLGQMGGVSVRGSAPAAGETLWGRLPCNPILTVRPAPLCKPTLTALNCYLWQTCLPDNRQPGVPLRPGLHGVKGMRVGGWVGGMQHKWKGRDALGFAASTCTRATMHWFIFVCILRVYSARVTSVYAMPPVLQ